jgi:tRNA(Ile)-lysidine synthase
LEREWLSLGLPADGGPLVIAVSGGTDSTALLLATKELIASGRLSIDLTAAYLDHGLRGEAGAADAEWLGELTRKHGIALVTGTVRVGEQARAEGENLEQAARNARYDFLVTTAADRGARFVLTAHTRDDQAETILMRLMRGAGPDGLTGIKPMRWVKEGFDVRLARPLLRAVGRAETTAYCVSAGIQPRHDVMNDDRTFSRVAVRQELLPLLKRFNPRIVDSLLRTAEVLVHENDLLQGEANRVLRDCLEQHEGSGALAVRRLRNEPTALRRRAIRIWLECFRDDLRRIETVHIQAIDRLVDPRTSGQIVELPRGDRVRRKDGYLQFLAKD